MINTPQNFRVQSPNGRIWDVPESNLDEAVNRGGEIVKKVQDSKGRIWEVPESKMQIALDRGGKLYEENPPEAQSPELGFSDRLLQLGRGVAEIPATAVDVGTNLATQSDVPGVAADVMAPIPINDPNQKNKNLEATNLTGKVHEKFNEIAGKDITPKDTLGHVLNTAGNFSFPVPGSGALKGVRASIEGVKQVGANLAKNTAVGVGGAAALEGTDNYRLTEKGSALGHVEDFVKTVLGMSLTNKALSGAQKKILEKSSKSLEEFVEHSGKTVKEEASDALEGATLREKAAGKVLSLGAKPNKRVTELAEKYDIQLPYQVALGGRFHKFVSNTALKSIFTADVYDNVIRNADEAMINSVKGKLNNVSSEIVSGEVASSRTKAFLEGEKKSINEEIQKRYNQNFSYLKPTDMADTKPMIEAIKSMLETPALKARVEGPQSKVVANHLKALGEQYGFIPPKKSLKEFEDHPHLLKKVTEAYENAPPVPVIELVGQLANTRQLINYEKDEGIRKLLQGVDSALRKSIETTENKEFLIPYQNTNFLYEQQVVDRIRTDLASSLMNGEIPTQAFEYMGAAPEIRKLGQIIGDSKNGKEIFSALKRAKLEQIVADKIVDASGTISYAKLSNMFLKNPENQAVLKELLGDQYKKLKELAEISQEFVKAGKDFGNPSGTSFAQRDMQGIGDLVRLGVNAAASFSLGASIHGLVGGIEAPLAINAISRLVSNKKYIDTAIKYAEAAKKNNAKSANVLESRMMRIAKGILEETGQYPQSSIALAKPSEDRK